MFRNPTTDILIVLFIVLIIFGPKRLPTLGKELGRGIREFKDSITTSSKDAEAAEQPHLTAASQVDAAAVPAPPAHAPTASPEPGAPSTGGSTAPAAPAPGEPRA